jgi:hypothetical protein
MHTSMLSQVSRSDPYKDIQMVLTIKVRTADEISWTEIAQTNL